MKRVSFGVFRYYASMCGRLFQCASPAQIASMFGIFKAPPNARARYNAAPRQDLLTVRFNPETRERSLDLLTWGLVPTWTKDLKKAVRPINAMSETVRTNRVFSAAFAKRRCLIPVDGFFEWWQQSKPKRPYAIAREDRQPFALAGLWENWQDPDTKEWLRTFTILTTSANSLVAKIHDRMPVILHADAYSKWLGEEEASADELHALCVPFPANLMTMWPVNPRMNTWKYEADDTLDLFEADPINSL